MTSIQNTIRVNAPREKVWAVLADLGSIHLFAPSVRKAVCTSTAAGGINASRVCELSPMGAIEEFVADWKPGETLALSVHPKKFAPPFATATVRFTLTPETTASAGSNQGEATRVVFSTDYTLKHGLLGQLLDAILFRPMSRAMSTDILLGLKHFTETGKPATPAVIRRIKRETALDNDPQNIPAPSGCC